MYKKILSILIVTFLLVNPARSFALFDDQETPQPEKTTIQKKLNFIDEGSKNESFNSFREELLKRIDKKDTKYLLSIIDPNLKFTLGDAREFKRFYSLDKEGDKSIIWRELKKILLLGGVFTDEGFCAPYVTCAWPEGMDPAGMAAIVGSDVKLHQRPNASSPVVATLNYDIVKTTYDSAALRAGWKAVQMLGGRKGYVKSSEAIVGNDYRAFFKEKNGKWYLSVYISG